MFLSAALVILSISYGQVAVQGSSVKWQLAFRGTAGVGKSVFEAYMDGTGIPKNVEAGCQQLEKDQPCSNHYRNKKVFDNWSKVRQIKFAVYSGNTAVKEVVFRRGNSNTTSWYDAENMVSSTWKIMDQNVAGNYFSIVGHGTEGHSRRFFINTMYGGCEKDRGYFVVLDSQRGMCDWDTPLGVFPEFKYSSQDGDVQWQRWSNMFRFSRGDNDGEGVKKADAFGIFVSYT